MAPGARGEDGGDVYRVTEKAHLDVGSGLEGYIAWLVALQLNLPLTVENNPQTGIWMLGVSIGRGPQVNQAVAAQSG